MIFSPLERGGVEGGGGCILPGFPLTKEATTASTFFSWRRPCILPGLHLRKKGSVVFPFWTCPLPGLQVWKGTLYSSRIPFSKGRPPTPFLKRDCCLHFFFIFSGSGIPSDDSDWIAGDGGGGEQLGEVLLHPESGGTHVRPLVHTLRDQASQVPQALAKNKTSI